MCILFCKYYLITATCFFSLGGLYLVCLTDFLWPYEIKDLSYDWKAPFRSEEEIKVQIDEGKFDWKIVIFYSGITGLIVFTPGVIVMVRARPKELKYYSIFLIIPFFIASAASAWQIFIKIYFVYYIKRAPEDLEFFDPADLYLIGLTFGILSVIIIGFVYQRELTKTETQSNNSQLKDVIGITSGNYQMEHSV